MSDIPIPVGAKVVVFGGRHGVVERHIVRSGQSLRYLVRLSKKDGSPGSRTLACHRNNVRLP